MRSCWILRDIQFGSHGQWREHDIHRAYDQRLGDDYSDFHEQPCSSGIGDH
jgi:hypothetical protein